MEVEQQKQQQAKPISAAAIQVQAKLLTILEQLSSEPTPPTQEQRLALLATTAPLFAHLRAVSRKAHDDTRRGKRKVIEARQQVDTSSLVLQNLTYQKRHLEEEIRTCRDFQSVYQTINLTDVEDFKARAPADLTTAEVLDNPHALQLARLRFELSERKRLEDEKQAVQERRTSLAQENKTKKQRLEGLEADLKDMLGHNVHVRKRFEDASDEQKAPEPDRQQAGSATTPASTAAQTPQPTTEVP